MSAVNRLLHAVRRRERLADAARALTRWALPSGLFIAAASILAVRLLGAPSELVWSTALPLPVLAVWALARRRSLRHAARRIDAHYGLDDTIGNAYELALSPPRAVSGDDHRTRDIIELLRDQAEGRAKGLDPQPVVPLRVPGPRWVDAVALAAVVLAVLWPRPQTEAMRQWMGTPQLEQLLVLPTRAGLDLALADPLRQNLRALEGDEDEAATTAERILEILDKLESGELDRAEAFAELEKLEELLREAEEQFEAQLDEDPGMLADTVRDLAEALQEQEVTEDAGKAFDEGRPEDAEQALNDAADEAEEGTADDQEAMRQAMEEAERALSKSEKQAAKKASDTAQQLDDAERRLRREQKKKDPKDPEEHERRLKRMKDRVEQLRRQQEREQAAQRRLDQLRRNASDAAKKRNSQQQRKRSLQKLSRGASGAARKSRQSSRMRQARDALDEAKTFVRRAGQQGDSANRRRKQFRKFSKAAKGQKGKKGKGKGKGKTTLLVEGDVGEGKSQMFMEGDGQGQGQGQDGQGQGQGEDGQGQGQGQGQDGGQGVSPGGDGMGEGSVDPLGEDSSLASGKKNVRVKAREGRGVSRAEVIRESSQQGFANEAYRDVFTDYRRFAQSALDNEALPPAKRRAVKRYYQLISPRE